MNKKMNRDESLLRGFAWSKKEKGVKIRTTTTLPTYHSTEVTGSQ